jgi:hypothetical protein
MRCFAIPPLRASRASSGPRQVNGLQNRPNLRRPRHSISGWINETRGSTSPSPSDSYAERTASTATPSGYSECPLPPSMTCPKRPSCRAAPDAWRGASGRVVGSAGRSASHPARSCQPLFVDWLARGGGT